MLVGAVIVIIFLRQVLLDEHDQPNAQRRGKGTVRYI